jgi:hypothetical protein
MTVLFSLLAVLVLSTPVVHAVVFRECGEVQLELYTANRTTLITSPMVNDIVIDSTKTPSLNV